MRWEGSSRRGRRWMCWRSWCREYLDDVVIPGERQLNHLLAMWVEHYHTERPDQALANAPLDQPKQRGRPKTQHGPIEDQIVPLSEVCCKQRLGGLLKS